ncbi:hypothetical protein LCGC14_0932770 [marine sediment metagenome]|uniref:Uncharacterized protein n=1 Tax=marine sediment metagenome TaxID=412755 RepID=A0A0F9NMI3_9ZZZZ
MIINNNNRDIWQFGEQYIDGDTGKDATSEEIVIFKQKVEEQRLVGAKMEKIHLQKEKEWHLKYDSLIWDFFEYEELGMDKEDLLHLDDEYLAYHLATYLFDRASGYGFEQLQTRHPNDWEKELDEIKQKFPDHWERALENYKCRNHDT